MTCDLRTANETNKQILLHIQSDWPKLESLIIPCLDRIERAQLSYVACRGTDCTNTLGTIWQHLMVSISKGVNYTEHYKLEKINELGVYV